MPELDSSKDEKVEILLDGISIENYRSFSKFPDNGYLDIGRFTTIIGRNDVGKSNLLHAILLVLGKGKPKAEDYHKKQYDKDIVIKLRFSINGDPNEIEKVKEELNKYNLPVIDNKFYIGVRYIYNRETDRISEKWFTCKSKRNLYGISIKEEDISRSYIAYIREKFLPRPLYISSFTTPSDEVSLKQGSLLSELISPLIEESIIELKAENRTVKMKDLLKQKIEEETDHISDRLTKYLKRVWEDIDRVRLVVSEVKLSRALNIDVRLEDKYIGDISLFKRGSGLQREFIAELLRVYRDLKIGKGYILMIEEPEIFLHAGAQKRFLSILKDLSKEGQVIITTHSSIFIDRSDLRYTYLFKKKGGHTILAWETTKQAEITEIVEELGISPSDILLANGVIIVEGPTDKKVLEIFAKSIIERWDEYNIAIIHAGGKSNIYHYQEYPDVLKKLNNNIVIILDADIRSDSEELPQNKNNFKKKMEKYGIPVYFWTKNGKYVRELENLFDIESLNELLEETIKKSGKVCTDYTIKSDELTRSIDVVDLYIRKLRKCGLPLTENDKNKIKQGLSRKVPEIMVHKNRVPEDVKGLIFEILRRFNIQV